MWLIMTSQAMGLRWVWNITSRFTISTIWFYFRWILHSVVSWSSITAQTATANPPSETIERHLISPPQHQVQTALTVLFVDLDSIQLLATFSRSIFLYDIHFGFSSVDEYWRFLGDTNNFLLGLPTITLRLLELWLLCLSRTNGN